MDKKDRVLYIDGVKGISCMGVLLYHFYTTFSMQATNMPASAVRDILFSDIFKLITDGTLLVCLFAILSGWLVSKSSVDTFRGLISKCVFRYLRFAIPLSVVCVCIKICQLLGVLNNTSAASILGIDSFKYLYQENVGGGIETRIH